MLLPCIIEKNDVEIAPKGMILLTSDNPYASYAKIILALYPNEANVPYIAKSVKIDDSAQVHGSCYIGENVVIGQNVQIGSNTHISHNSVISDNVIIGNNCKIMSNVTISHSIIGNGCVFHSGARLGQDGLGYAPTSQGMLAVKQVGRVLIGNYVEIGSNTCVDRGAIEDTVIGDNTKIDNLVQIAHNVKIGSNSIIVSQVGIAGSTVIGSRVMLGGQVGISGHVKIGDSVMIAAQSGVIGDVESGMVMGGTPAPTN